VLAASVLDGTAGFRADWLAVDDKLVVPVAAPSGLDGSIARRCAAGARSVSAAEYWVCDLGQPDSLARPVRAVADQIQALTAGGQILVILPDLSAAVWMSGAGYVLGAGGPRFLRGFCVDGVDGDRARFRRDAARLQGRFPALGAVAERHPPRMRVWSTIPDPGSAVAEQLALMRALAAGELAAPRFARQWSAAGRRSDDRGERVRGPLAEALTDVFHAVEDYVEDPELRDPGDLADDDLVAAVRSALAALPPS
jgi:hypothetical protein